MKVPRQNFPTAAPIDGISAPLPKIRQRAWDSANRDSLWSVRGIPQGLQGEIKKIAMELGVPIGDVARLLLEHGLDAYRAGKLPISKEGGKYRIVFDERK